MKATGAVCFLLLLCSFSAGADQSMASPSISLSETSSPSTHNSTAAFESPTNSTDYPLNTSSEVDHSPTTELSANSTLIHGENDTMEAPGSTTAIAITTVSTITAQNGTSVPGNLTNSQKGSDHTTGESHTLSNITTPSAATLPSTQLPITKLQTNTSAPTRKYQTLPPLTQSTTASHKSSAKETTAQSKQKPSSTTRTVPATINLQATKVSKPHSSTPVQAKARADTPSQLNVGDDDLKASMDPLLAGLVSVFVVTAIIISLLIFLKFKRSNERPEFRRLQDLPMDDMMEDTPLSMYSY